MPTHLQIDGRAYPIDERPIALGAAPSGSERDVTLLGNTAGVSRTHCKVLRRGNVVVVEDLSRHGSSLNGERFDGEVEAGAGDRLRVGAPGIEMQFIVVDAGG